MPARAVPGRVRHGCQSEPAGSAHPGPVPALGTGTGGVVGGTAVRERRAYKIVTVARGVRFPYAQRAIQVTRCRRVIDTGAPSCLRDPLAAVRAGSNEVVGVVDPGSSDD